MKKPGSQRTPLELFITFVSIPEDVAGQGTSSFLWVVILQKAALPEKAVTLKNRLDIGS